MTPVADPTPERGEPERERGGDREGFAPSPFVIGGITLAIGVLAGYLLFGQKPGARTTPQASYATDAPAATPPRLGDLAVNRLPSLDAWDPFDPFATGYPVPPDDYIPPLVPPGPPVPAVPPVPETAPVAPGGAPDSGGGFAPMGPPAITGDVPRLPPMTIPGFPPGGGPPEVEVTPTDPNAKPGSSPDVTATPPKTPQEAPFDGKVRYVAVEIQGVDPKRAKSAVAAVASKYKGASRTFTHYGADAIPDAEGVVVLVPMASADKALADIRKLGAASLDEDLTGSPAERAGKMRALFSKRLGELRKRRDELLVQFLPEAEPIKDLDAAIAAEARAIAAVRLTGAADRLAAIRVLLRE